MKPLLLMRVASSARSEVKIAVGTVVIILMMPIITVLVILHSGLSFLSLGTADALYQGPVSTTNTYAWGNCTYWAALQRELAHDPIPNTWGNANTWAFRAQLDGYLVDHTPTAGAVMQTSGGDLGHVAYVTDVDPNTGTWTISEMNVKGLDIVDVQTYPASRAQSYNFIHDKTSVI
jgi:surface antigen